MVTNSLEPDATSTRHNGSFPTRVGWPLNCAGALQQSVRDDLAAVHVGAPLALFAACQDLGIKRVVQISAMGAGLQGASAFARTKGEADAALAASALPWI